MSQHLVCSCGAYVTLETGSRQALCPACGARVEAPATKEAVRHEDDCIEPLSIEQVSTQKGECWKLVCVCNKRLLVPLKASSAIGRCPKCGRKLRMPAHARKADPAAAPAPAPPDHAKAKTAPTTPDDDLSDLLLDPPPSDPRQAMPPEPAPPKHSEPAPPKQSEDAPAKPPLSVAPAARIEEPASRGAALRTADILRSKKVSERTPGPGLISAWPLAGILPRVLAGFIDLTLGLIAATLIVVGGSMGLLPPSSQYWFVPVIAFFTATLLNDCLLQAFGGTVGKRLVVLTLRTSDGLAPSLSVVLLRAVAKWLLCPGWLVGLVHPTQRTLHDILCNTYVLKGRVRHG